MSRESLALRYRPQDFDDVVQQDASIEILQNQIANSTFKQAYLFAGASGCGKTTTARIFAKKIDGDVIEINCADNNSVDDIRELIAQASLKPLTGKYKVYILDEAHMFSKSAFNAMLKLLEEPPKHCIFILCTTDPQNILPTVLGRLQRFNFSRITDVEIVERLKFILDSELDRICEEAGNDIQPGELFKYTEDALFYIARLAKGGMRDAITMLDSILDYDKDVTVESVVECCGAVNYDDVLDLAFGILDNAPNDCIRLLDNIYYSGKDISLFLKDMYMSLVGISKYLLSKDFTATTMPTEYKKDVDELEFKEVVELLDIIGQLIQEAKYEKNSILMIEGKLLRLL